MNQQADRTIGRYVLFDEIAAGGMATVHLGKLKGPVGFSRTVAIKKLHPEYARDPQFVSMFLDEARLASRVRHPNVVPTLDVVTTEGQLFLVMEYVQGVSLAMVLDTTSARKQRVPPRIVAAIVSGALMGLHAAHEACDEEGQNLGIVHRDVSPSNVLVGSDGLPRVLDFGVAKAAGRMHNTRGNVLKGTLGYIAPEQFNKEYIDRRADVYSASVMLWEALCGQPLFEGETEYAVIAQALFGEVKPPSSVAPELAPFDEVVMKGLDREPEGRWRTAREMALAVERTIGSCSPSEVAEWVATIAADVLADRARVLANVEGGKGRRLSEIRAAMISALDLEESTFGGEDDRTTLNVEDEAPPSADLTDHTASAAPARVTKKKRAAWGYFAAITITASVFGSGIAWMQFQKTAKATEAQRTDLESQEQPGAPAVEAPPAGHDETQAVAPPGSSTGVPAPGVQAPGVQPAEPQPVAAPQPAAPQPEADPSTTEPVPPPGPTPLPFQPHPWPKTAPKPTPPPTPQPPPPGPKNPWDKGRHI